MRELVLRVSALTVISLSGAAPAFAAANSCNRECLVSIANRYLVALVEHQPANAPIAAASQFTENGNLARLGEGSWQAARGIRAQRQYVADVAAGQIGIQAIIDGTDDQLQVLAVRLKVEAGQIVEIESLHSHDGEGGPAWLPEMFLYRESPYVREVPLATRTSRVNLLRAVERYWDLATTTHKGYEAPYASDCFRFENGMSASWEAELSEEQLKQRDADLVGNGYVPDPVDGRIWGCARELTLTTRNWVAARDRHYLVDEERGLVMSFAAVDAESFTLMRQQAGNATAGAREGGPAAGGPPAGGPAGGPPGGSLTRPAQIGSMISTARNMAPGPPGMSMKGVQQTQVKRVIYQAQVNWIADGKIKREQVFMHVTTKSNQ